MRELPDRCYRAAERARERVFPFVEVAVDSDPGNVLGARPPVMYRPLVGAESGRCGRAVVRSMGVRFIRLAAGARQPGRQVSSTGGAGRG